MKDLKEVKNDTSLLNEEQGIERSQNSRRSFLKKAVYSAPALVAMGQLVKPVNAHADTSGDPAGHPSGWNP